MLTETNHWMGIAGTAIDGLLLLRVLTLRLHRIYVFITLACLISFFFDVVNLWLTADSKANVRVFLYSRFLFAVLFPLIGWDVFEEMKAQISKLRRLATGRLITGLFFAAIFGFLVSAFAESNETAGEPALVVTLGLVLWAGSSTATLAFLWTLHRGIRAQSLERPNNTSVWLIYWELSLLSEVLYCFCFLTFPFFKNTVADLLTLLFLVYGILITLWCILKLRRLPTGMESTPANASL